MKYYRITSKVIVEEIISKEVLTVGVNVGRSSMTIQRRYEGDCLSVIRRMTESINAINEAELIMGIAQRLLQDCKEMFDVVISNQSGDRIFM